jgi:cytochrome c5
MKLTPPIAAFVLVLGIHPGVARSAEKPEGLVVGLTSNNGPLLLGELSCTACHTAEGAAERLFVKEAPRLGDVGARVTPDYLRAFLTAPQKVKPTTPMPDLLHALPAEQRDATVDLLVHFLVSQGGPLERRAAPADAKLLERGKTLYHTVGCVACHAAYEAPPRHKIDPNAPRVDDDEKQDVIAKPRVTVPLGQLARKTTPQSLALFLANPLHTRPSGRMPSLSLTADEARAIAIYLMREQPGQEKPRPTAAFVVDVAKVERGRAEFARLGCASCHDSGLRKDPEKLNLVLLGATATGVAPKDNRSPPQESPRQAIDNSATSKYLNFGKEGSGLVITIPGAPLVVTQLELASANDSPDRDPASYLLEGSQDGKTFTRLDTRSIAPFADRFASQRFTIDNKDAYSVFRLTFPTLVGGRGADAMQIGKVRLFAGPKPQPGVASTLKAPPLAKLNIAADSGCLGDKVAASRPRFAFSPEQRQALRTAVADLQKPATPSTPARSPEQTLMALNCYACHRRGNYGGPDAQLAPYFTYEVVVDLGDEGRMPPALHEVGAKLTSAGFEDTLFAGLRYRMAMATRMPLFGKANVGHLPEMFQLADAGKVAAYKPELSPRMVEEGRQLSGNKALGCVNCHAWGGSRVSGAEGLDLLQAVRRLRPEWFHALLVDPQQLKPRTRMPGGWPKGVSFFPEIEKGDMNRQIDSVWAYLSAGKRAAPPAGLIVGPSRLLIPGDEPIVYRTFLDGVSATAVLVGFKEGMHLAFDANRVRSVVAWSGEFIGTEAAWEGRGGMYAKIPSPDQVQLPSGPPLAVLASLGDRWPADKPKAKMGTNRTPDGWRFNGYRYDDKGMPTFLYRAGTVHVEESPSSDFRQANGCLVRRFRFTSGDQVKNLYFRVATGKKIVEKDGVFTIDDRLSYRVKTTPESKPQRRTVDGQEELLVPIGFGPPGADKEHEAKLELELTWVTEPTRR